MWLATIAGLALGGVIVAHSWYQVNQSTAPNRESQYTRLQFNKSTIATLKTELAAQNVAFQKLQASDGDGSNGKNFGGFSEDDVNYWRKQMDAYSRLTGIQVDIRAVGPSQFRDSLALVVSVESTATDGGYLDLIRALDFLQNYGYMESFNGTEAVLHITQSNSRS